MTIRVALCVAGLIFSAGGLRADPPAIDPQPIADALRPIHAAAQRVRLAQSDLEQCRERAAWSERMVKRGYASSAQAQAERARAVQAELDLEDACAVLRAGGTRPNK
jgi:hypothetical protein